MVAREVARTGAVGMSQVTSSNVDSTGAQRYPSLQFCSFYVPTTLIVVSHIDPYAACPTLNDTDVYRGSGRLQPKFPGGVSRDLAGGNQGAAVSHLQLKPNTRSSPDVQLKSGAQKALRQHIAWSAT